MKKIDDFHIVKEEQARAGWITRREVARRLLAGVAASVTSHPIWRHLSDEHLRARVETATVDRKLHFLTPQQFGSLTAMAEAIVPGSTKAGVARFLDSLLSVENEKSRTAFLQSLDAMDSESHNRFGRNFVTLGASQKDEVLTTVSSTPGTDQNERLLHDAFENLKEWISGA